MAVLGGLEVLGLGEVQLLYDDTGAEVEVLVDDLDELVGATGGGAVAVNEDGKGLGDTNGVGELHERAASELGVDEGLGDPAGEVSGGTVDLGEVLAGEGTTTVGTPSTVGVNNDLTASETGVTLGTTNDEQTRGLDVVDGLVVQVLGRDDLLDDLLLDLLAELLGGDGLGVLRRDNHSVDSLGNNGTVVVLVLNGDLGLGVGSQPGDASITAGRGHRSVELVGQLEGQGEELRGLVSGVSEHDTLVTGTQCLEAVVQVQTLGDIGRLLLNGNEDVAGLVVETLGGVVVTDVLDGVTDDLLVVDLGLGGDLPEHHDHTGLGGGFASNLGERVLGQAGVEDGIGDLIGNLVGVTLTDGLRLSQKLALKTCSWKCPATYSEQEGALVVVQVGLTIAVLDSVDSHCD